MSKFTQKQFNIDHTEPREYGEWEYCIVGDQYSDEEAAKLIGEWESELTGDTHSYDAINIRPMEMFVGRDDNSDEAWVLNPYSDKTPVAWGKGVSLL